MDVNGHFHAPSALLPRKELPVHIGYEAGCVADSFDVAAYRKTSLYQKSNPDRLDRNK
jgi:hypothetical protein